MENQENNSGFNIKFESTLKPKRKLPLKTIITASVIVVLLIITLLVTPFIVKKFFKIPLTPTNEVRAYINSFYLYDINDDDLKYGAAKGMVEALGDPYTRYLTPDEFEEYKNSAKGDYIGIGVVFTLNDDGVTVAGTFPGSPGEKSGLKIGDILISADDKECNKDTYEDIVSYIRGEHINITERENTSVDLKCKRQNLDGSKEIFIATLKREAIHTQSVTSQMEDDKIGYIKISSFNTDTHNEFDEAYKNLLSSGMKKLIIDLRDNGGGNFDVVRTIAGKFLEDNSLVVYTVDKNENTRKLYSDKKEYEINPVILINSGSASASEIFTAALRDHKKSTAIIGTRSFGKGVTQSVFSMKSGGGLIITVDKYYTPNGDTIHEKGITPTDIVEIEPPYDQFPAAYYTAEIDTQKAYALNLLKSE